MRQLHVVGDLRPAGDGTVDGWCWAPHRPAARVAYDILVDDRVVGSGVAALPRPDLAIRGMRDTAHGYRLALPPGAIDPHVPCLISARAREGGVVFGRRRLEPSAGAAEDPVLVAMQSALADISERLAIGVPPATPATRLRAAFGTLAETLPPRPGMLGADIAAVRKMLAAGPTLVLARPAAPRVSLLLPAGGDVRETLARLRCLAPATHALAAETLLLNGGEDARTVLLPSVVPGLLRCRGWEDASRQARGEWVLLLDETWPSAAGLEALVARLQTRTGPAVSGRLSAGAAASPSWRLPAPTGVALAIRRALLGTGHDLPALLRREAAQAVAVVEPWT